MLSLLIIALTALAALLLGLRAGRGRDMNLEQWTVGGRGFGAVFVFLLMAGEIYTTFTFLGGSGYAYGHGGPHIHPGLRVSRLCDLVLDAAAIWLCAAAPAGLAARLLRNQVPDSPAVGVLVAVVGIVAMVPYLVLQFKGLGIIVAAASSGAVPAIRCVWIGAGVVTASVMVSGVHGSAWTVRLAPCFCWNASQPM